MGKRHAGEKRSVVYLFSPLDVKDEIQNRQPSTPKKYGFYSIKTISMLVRCMIFKGKNLSQVFRKIADAQILSLIQ